MPPDRALPPSILAALGLMAGCAASACLMMAAPPETGEATTGDTAEPDGADDTGQAPAPLPTPSVFQRLEAAGVLPPDVVERLSRRGG